MKVGIQLLLQPLPSLRRPALSHILPLGAGKGKRWAKDVQSECYIPPQKAHEYSRCLSSPMRWGPECPGKDHVVRNFEHLQWRIFTADEGGYIPVECEG